MKAWPILILSIILAFVMVIAGSKKNNNIAKEKNMKPTYKAIKAKPTTLIIHCSDPRFQFALNCFFYDDLDLPYGQFVPIVVAGGPAKLVNPIATQEKYLSSQIMFFLRHFP